MNLISVIGLIFLSAISKAICDLIRFKGYPKGDWWLAKGKFSYDKRTWLTKHIFSFAVDGWHFFDMLRVMTLCIALTLCTNISIFWALLFYTLHGIIFEIIYNHKY